MDRFRQKTSDVLKRQMRSMLSDTHKSRVAKNAEGGTQIWTSVKANRKLFGFDCLAIGLSATFTSLTLWYEKSGTIPAASMLAVPLVVVLLSLFLLPTLQLYLRDVRSTSLPDVYHVVRALAVLHMAMLVLSFLPLGLFSVSVAFVLANFFVSVFALLMLRAIARQREQDRREQRSKDCWDSRVPVLVIGTGAAADLFIRSLQEPGAKYEAVGIVDDMTGRDGLYFHNARILGSILAPDRLQEEVEKLKRLPKRLILTENIGHFGANKMQYLLDWASRKGIEVARLPDLARSDVGQPSEPRQVSLDAILNRPEKAIELELLSRLLHGRRVLVTGAGGSIGSELVRQVASFEPAELVLIDNCEFNTYSIDKSLGRDFSNVNRHPYVADIREVKRINTIFDTHKPEVVFNAAALKHVPMVEMNPCEGVLTNVVGTRNIADASRRVGAVAMVQISTDKAVNSTNVMGASKRVAEFYVQAQDRITEDISEKTRFFSVRFGNVLGSSGSLIPLFQEQISCGGPLTVTDPRMERYFMTIREAVELTLVSAAKGLESDVNRGTIFVLDMGKPVKIVDIANRMIRLAGLEPGRDIDIEFTGIRPGEKLSEELFDLSEERHPSGIEGVQAARPFGIHIGPLRAAIVRLEKAAQEQKNSVVRSGLAMLVPGFDALKTEVIEAETIVSDTLAKTVPANKPHEGPSIGAQA